MSTARDRAAQLRKRDQPAVEPEPAPAPPVRPAKVRQTVDLTGDQHAALAAWRLDTALQLGRTRLTTQDVLAAAVAVLLDDDTVARRIRAHLESQ
jgi:hypothetical protein